MLSHVLRGGSDHQVCEPVPVDIGRGDLRTEPIPHLRHTSDTGRGLIDLIPGLRIGAVRSALDHGHVPTAHPVTAHPFRSTNEHIREAITIHIMHLAWGRMGRAEYQRKD
nr:hypothetical protein [Nocardiopsis sp. MG754419]